MGATIYPTTIERATLYRDHGLRPADWRARQLEPGDRVKQPVGNVVGTYKGITARGTIQIIWDR